MQFVIVISAFILVMFLKINHSKSHEVEKVNVHVTKGGDISLSCLLRNNCSNVTWSENGRNIADNGFHKTKCDGQLKLQVNGISSSSLFRCEVTHQNTTFQNSSFKESISFHINILDIKPIIVIEGENKSLSCPGGLANVSWNGQRQESLVLTNVRRGDSHTVKCSGFVKGNYSLAKVNQTVKLDVQYIPENVTLTFSPNPARLDHVLKIFCKADGNPAPQKFMWYKDGQFIENNKGNLTKTSLTYADGGNYICLPEFAVENKSILVIVKGAPSAPQQVKLIISLRSKTSLGLSWEKPENNGNDVIVLYEVSIKTPSPDEWHSQGNTSSLNYTAKDLQSGTKYIFRVRGFNSFGGGEWSETVTDITAPDNKMPSDLKVERVNHTNVIKAQWIKPNEDVEFLYELCYQEGYVGDLHCRNTSELTWVERTLKENRDYLFKVRACKVGREECSEFTSWAKVKTGREPPKKPSSLKTTFVSSTFLNVTWNTNSYNEVYYVDYRELDSNNWNQQTVLKEQRCRINHLSPNTTYIVRVYAVIVTADDNQKVFGEAIERSFTTDTTTAPSPTATTPGIRKNNTSGLKSGLIALGIFAVIAAFVAAIFLLLYLRSSYICYHRLGRRRPTIDAFTLDNVGEAPRLSPRERITSYSSFRKQAICKTSPIEIDVFQDHVKRLHCDSDYLFSLEFEAIGSKKHFNEKDKKVEITCLEGKKATNKPKNRYADIVPYDHSRVILTELDDDPDSSYINASYIDSYRKERAYIAAQGPLGVTVSDFWRMIWESNSCVVVMVTNLFERSRSKCVKYWPDSDSADYGLIRVTMLKEESFANYVVRSFSIQPVPDQAHYITINGESESRTIQQFHYTEWPDHDVPVHPAAILRFIRKSKAASPVGAGPIVVHCSAGVGRSGTYIVIDSMMERIEDEKAVDIFNFLNHIRTQRKFLVQEESQYIFVHDALLEYIKYGDSNIPLKEFPKHVESLLKVNPDKKKTGLQEEFQDIDHTKTMDKHKWAAKKACNTLKNRRKDVLPVERTRVKLPPLLGIEGADYINASYIDGFSKNREYIATQAPLNTTAESFWRMVWAVKCNIIVMLLDDEEWKKDDYLADLPTAEEEVQCGKFEIQLESEEVSEHVTVRKLRLFVTSDSNDGRTVSHYHYRHWSADGFPRDKTSVITFIEQVRNHKLAESEKAPITVYCDFGVGRTGVFCLLSTLYDQLEKEGSLDVYQTAKLYRLQRPKLIETEEQYEFCYDILNQLVSTKLGFPSTESGNAHIDNPEVLGTNNPNPEGMVYTDLSDIDHPDVSETANMTDSATR